MTKPHNILIADDFHPILLQMLDQKGVAYAYRPKIERSEILELLNGNVTGLVIRSKTHVDEELLSSAKQLQFIARGGAGMDNVDEELAIELGIRCFNAGEANSDAVGEHCVGMLLALFRKIHTADAEVRQGLWYREANRGLELNGRTVGIIGYGNTGSAFARKLAGFNVRILAYDKYKTGFGTAQVEECSMENIFLNAEVVSFHVPLDGQTRFMVNSEFIQRFVRNIFLMNLSRGKIVSTTDVVQALEQGKIAGFAADVLEHENPPQMGKEEHLWFDKLISRPNVLLTPHIAGWTQESYFKIAEVLGRKILAEMEYDLG